MDSSWQWKKLNKVKLLLLDGVDNGQWRATGDGCYSIATGYRFLQGELPRDNFAYKLWKSKAIPKHIFVVWLATRNRLLTYDRLQAWGITVSDDKCILCDAGVESVHHLFFACPFSKALLQALASWLRIDRVPLSLGRWTHWLVHLMQRRSWTQDVRVMGLLASLYHIWAERNARRHDSPSKTVDQRLSLLRREVLIRAEAYKGRMAHSGDMAFWSQLQTV